MTWLHRPLCRLLLQQRHLRLPAGLVDLQEHLAVLRLLVHGGGVVGATAAADDAGVEQAGFHLQAVAFVRGAEDHGLGRGVGDAAGVGQALLEGQVCRAKGADLRLEGVPEGRGAPGLQ